MFTGIVEELGRVVALEHADDSARLTVRGALVTGDVRPGESISVNGCCLTVAEHAGDTFTADVMLETLDRTSLGGLAPGSPVNLERAVTPVDRLGGHLVQGHVDAVGTIILSRTHSERWDVVTVTVPADLIRYVAHKGSIAIDGVSLTVSALDDGLATDDGPGSDDELARREPTLSVSLIPTTLALTTLGSKQPGDRVNLEVDVVAKYVERLLSAGQQPRTTTQKDG